MGGQTNLECLSRRALRRNFPPRSSGGGQEPNDRCRGKNGGIPTFIFWGWVRGEIRTSLEEGQGEKESDVLSGRGSLDSIGKRRRDMLSLARRIRGGRKSLAGGAEGRILELTFPINGRRQLLSSWGEGRAVSKLSRPRGP